MNSTNLDRQWVDFREQNGSRKLFSRPPLLSSHHSGWQEIHLEYHHQQDQEVPEHCLALHHISIKLNAPALNERWMDGHFQREWQQPGYVGLIPAGISHRSASCYRGEVLIIGLASAQLTRAAEGWLDLDYHCLRPCFTLHLDPLILQLGLALKAELETNCGAGSLLVDSIANVLSIHLLQHYSTRQILANPVRGKLSVQQLHQVTEYIQGHLAQQIHLADLAQVTGLSQYYFSRMFRQSFGIPPYRYLLQQRIEQAKKLLRRQELSILEIAYQCGFANQSHFTKQFHKMTGVSPKIYQSS
jgi:AraC family transcriptional regulator